MLNDACATGTLAPGDPSTSVDAGGGGERATERPFDQVRPLGLRDGVQLDQPVIVLVGGGTGAITNTVGAKFFASRGVMVDDATGVVGAANNAVAALQAEQRQQHHPDENKTECSSV